MSFLSPNNEQERLKFTLEKVKTPKKKIQALTLSAINLSQIIYERIIFETHIFVCVGECKRGYSSAYEPDV